MRHGLPPDEPISPQEVGVELERILASPLFRKAPRHSRFLSFVVRKTLAGSGDCIKESLIGLEVFDRPPDYDPGAEPIVRVEAGRLRSRLAEYYDDSGRIDPIRINLPRGTYVPVFRRKGTPPASASAPAAIGTRATTIRRASIAVAVVIGIAVLLVARMLTTDSHAVAGRLDGSTLVVTNAKGEELWRRSFSEGFWRDYYDQGLATRMWFGDLEGDGRNEVLLLYHPAVEPKAHSTTLICYSDRGEEQWRWTPGRPLPELEGDPPTFETMGLGVIKGRPGEASRIVVSSRHTVWYPHQIAILDAHGKLLSEYWHSGHLNHLTLADLDGDGREEIIATGISNGYRQATLVVLDPDRVYGASAEMARPEIQIHGMGAAKERIRLLFRRSDLNAALMPYNEGSEVTVEKGDVRFATLECVTKGPYSVAYEFTTDFHLLSARAGDTFRGFHNEFYRNDKPPHMLTAEEESQFQKVRCLVGCRTEFVALQDGRQPD